MLSILHVSDIHLGPPFREEAAEALLEIAPTIGYADAIVDLVSSGTTLRENGLKKIDDGILLTSQAALVANKKNIQSRPELLAIARQLIEFIVANCSGGRQKRANTKYRD